MARRDNQGLQIAMIVFILTTLVFIVTTYLGWSSSQNLRAELAKAQSSAATAENGLRDSEEFVSLLKKYVGVASELDRQATEGALKEAVEETYGQGLPVENQNFQDIAARMTSQIQELNRGLAQASDIEKQLRAEVEQVRKTEGEVAAQALAAKAKAVDDLNKVQQQAQQYQTQLTAEFNTLRDQIDTTGRQMQDLRSTTAAQVQEAENKVTTLQNILEDRNQRIQAMETDTPDRFDGNVTNVVAATGTVWLNLGRAHGLRPKTTFSVYDAEDPNVKSAKKKASLEVTRVLNNYRSEARVTETDHVNPIVKGDLIFSPIWDPGTKLGIALVGPMDIDRDGTDDRAFIRNLIRLNGAQVDAEDVGGKVQGKMTVNTRYLVVGETDDSGETQNAALSPMLDSAALLGIERTSIDELLDLMGFAGRAKSVSFAGLSRPGEFAPQPQDGVTRSSTGSTSFRKRPAMPRRNRLNPSY